MRLTITLAPVLLLLAHPASAQTFVSNTADIPSGSPANSSTSEEVDFADVDLDGDWDAAFANGGDAWLDQNRLWVNQGGLQSGALGVFLDDTAARLPASIDASRDVEFVDFDGDGDDDAHISNTSDIVNLSNRWWTNLGGAQGGTPGFFADETAARWVGLGAPGSSVPATSVLGNGGFIDWASDSAFGDLDNDGDLDLVHASYGGGGNNPTRIFLNDGAGFFAEFNPSGFQLTSNSIQNGDPGLWCEGVQQANTPDTSGAFCDVASTSMDVDLGDLDGDFDLDLLQGALTQAPRTFANRLDSSVLAPSLGGAFGFRDVTSAVIPPGSSFGNAHYEQELGDLDGDGDLDVYGINWLAGMSFDDVTLTNDGAGAFTGLVTVAGSGEDDEEVDFFDYDNDGDLDAYVASFAGQDRLYRNNWNGVPGGGGAFSLTEVTGAELPTLTRVGSDGEVCDVNGDGDYDLFVANEVSGANDYVENVSQTPDTHAPYLPNLEQAPDRSTGVTPTVVRAHVFDNAPHYVTRHNTTWVEVTVGPGPTLQFPASPSGAQVFRAEIPGELEGTICYRFVSEDAYGNQGVSQTLCYEAYRACGTDPVGNYCVGAPNSAGPGATIAANDTLISIAANDLTLTCSGLPPSQPALAIAGPDQANLAFFDGTLCIDPQGLQRFAVAQTADLTGEVLEAVDLTSSATGGLAVSAGQAYFFQYWYRDPAALGSGANFSDAIGVCFVR